MIFYFINYFIKLHVLIWILVILSKFFFVYDYDISLNLLIGYDYLWTDSIFINILKSSIQKKKKKKKKKKKL